MTRINYDLFDTLLRSRRIASDFGNIARDFGKVHNELVCAYFEGQCRRIRDEVPDDRVLGTAPTPVQQQIMSRHEHTGTTSSVLAGTCIRMRTRIRGKDFGPTEALLWRHVPVCDLGASTLKGTESYT